MMLDYHLMDEKNFSDRTSLQKMAHSKVNGLGLASPGSALCGIGLMF